MASSSVSFPTTAPALRPCWRRGPTLPTRRRSSSSPTAATPRRNASGALVDAGMPVLRRRIREARMAETNYEAPAGWAAWEKRYYPAYVSDVSGLVGALQLALMGTRPGVALAVAALVLGGVPVSAVAALHQLAHVAESVLQSVHHVP